MFDIAIFILGLIVGSFLNVCIYRLPQKLSITTPPSHCRACGTNLKPWDLIPVISFILLRGRCRYCGTVLSFRYLLVELLTALLFVWCFAEAGLSWELIRMYTLTAFLIVITFIDFDYQIILDKVLIWLSGVGIAINLWTSHVSLLDMVSTSLIGGGLLLLIAIASQGGMGGGDIKFVAALGFWLGWKLILLTLLLCFIFGGIGGVVVLLTKVKGRKDFIPFGPFIALGAFLSLLYGYEIIKWYQTILL